MTWKDLTQSCWSNCFLLCFPSQVAQNTAQKMKFSIKDFFSKSDQIRSFLRIWSHVLKKSLMENFIFFAACVAVYHTGIYGLE